MNTPKNKIDKKHIARQRHAYKFRSIFGIQNESLLVCSIRQIHDRS